MLFAVFLQKIVKNHLEQLFNNLSASNTPALPHPPAAPPAAPSTAPPTAAHSAPHSTAPSIYASQSPSAHCPPASPRKSARAPSPRSILGLETHTHTHTRHKYVVPKTLVVGSPFLHRALAWGVTCWN